MSDPEADVDYVTRRVPRRLDAAGGWFIGGVEVRELPHDPDGVRGAVMIQDGDVIEVEARAVLLATGGYQNDAGFPQRFLEVPTIFAENARGFFSKVRGDAPA